MYTCREEEVQNLMKKAAEILIHRIEIKIVDERGGPHQPRGMTNRRGCSGAECATPAPSPAPGPRTPPSGGFLPGEKLLGHVVLAFLAERDHLQPACGDEPVDGGDERLGHRIDQRGGSAAAAAVTNENPCTPPPVSPGAPAHVAIHPVDAFDLELHVIRQDIAGGAR